MIHAVYTRKRGIDRVLKKLQLPPPDQPSHEEMCFAYIVVYGSLEFMIESVIRGWMQHYLKKHRYPYPNKNQVEKILKALQQNAEINLKDNHTIKYSRICELVGKLAGDTSKIKLKSLVATSSPGGAGELIASIDRISHTRHRMAHGLELPSAISPNVNELEKDFQIIYERLIRNLDTVLPRR